MALSQWDCLLKHIGVWQGSFTQFSPTGKMIKDTPSQLTLTCSDDRQTIRLTLHRENCQPIVNEFTHLNRSIFLFEDGHFAKGSLQFSPYAIFGAEYGFIRGDRRCRLVQLYDTQSQLESVTLIREFRQGGNGKENPPLSVKSLEGEWQGEAITLYPDWRNSNPYTTFLQVRVEKDRVKQTFSSPETSFTSEGVIQDNTITFYGDNYQIRVLLLPDGASSVTPVRLQLHQPFFLEFGWLVTENLRLRLIRRYDSQGRWLNVTLVKEKKLI